MCAKCASQLSRLDCSVLKRARRHGECGEHRLVPKDELDWMTVESVG